MSSSVLHFETLSICNPNFKGVKYAINNEHRSDVKCACLLFNLKELSDMGLA